MNKPSGHVYHVTDGERIDGDAIVAEYLFRIYLYPKRTINATFVFLSTSPQFDVSFSREITLDKKQHLFEIRELARTTVQVNDNETLCLINLEFIPQ